MQDSRISTKGQMKDFKLDFLKKYFFRYKSKDLSCYSEKSD